MSFEHMTTAELVRTQGVRSDLSPLERELIKRLEYYVDNGRQAFIDSHTADIQYDRLKKMKPFEFTADTDGNLDHV